MECFAVPSAASSAEFAACDADAVAADELGELRAGVGVVAEAWVQVVCIRVLLPGGKCPVVKPLLHGLAERAGGFAGDDGDGACFKIKLVPAQVEYIAQALAVGAEAAEDGRCPFVREFGDEELYFCESECLVDDFFVFGVGWDGDFIARVALDDFGVYSPLECSADGGEVFAAGGAANLGAAVVYPRFDVGSGDFSQG